MIKFMPADEWDAHGGFDLTDDDDLEYGGDGLGEDDPDDWRSEADADADAEDE